MKATDFNVRVLDLEKDYDTIASWWGKWGRRAPKKQWLTSPALVVEYKLEPAAAVWLMTLSATLGLLGFPVSKPTLAPRAKKRAMEILLSTASNDMRGAGFDGLLAFSDRKGLTRFYEGAGYARLQPHDALLMEWGDNHGT